MVTENLLSTDLVAVGHGNIVHLVSETNDKHVFGVGNGGGDTSPYGDVLLCLLFLPVSHNHFAWFAQT